MKITHQIKRFIVAGTVNSGVGYLLYVCGILIFNLSYFWAVAWSYVLATSFSYFTFRTFVFTTGERSWRSFARFIPTYVVLFFTNVLALHVLVDLVGWNKLIAQAFVIPGCAVLSFLINRIFVFK